jgi:protein-S-isoprenylcysteine O-methyltransferase Ste14
MLALGVQLQVRSVEEPYLLGRHGQTYRDYARAVGRFVPWLGRLA